MTTTISSGSSTCLLLDGLHAFLFVRTTEPKLEPSMPRQANQLWGLRWRVLPHFGAANSIASNSSGLNDRPSRTSARGSATLYQGSIVYSVSWNSIFRVSVTRLEASRISSETRFPSSS